MKIKTNNLQIEYFFLLVSNSAMLFYLIGLGIFNSFIADDYEFASLIHKNGIIQFVVNKYNTWQGTFGSFLILGTKYRLESFFSSLVPLTIVQLIIGITSLFLILKLLLPKIETLLILLISSFLVNLSILGLFKIGTFYWICASTYVDAVFITLLLIWIIFNPKIKKYLALISILLVTFFLGGDSEVYTPMVIMCLGIFFLIRLIKYGIYNLTSNFIDQRLFMSLIFLTAFFLFILFAPGSSIRLDSNGISGIHPTGLDLVIRTSKKMIVFMFQLTAKMGYYLIAFPLMFYVGRIAHENNIGLFTNKKINFSHFFLSLVFLLSFFWISILPGVYALNGLAPERTFSFVSFVMVAFIGFWGIFLGNRFPFNNLSHYLLILTCLVTIIISINFSLQDFPKCKLYQREIQEIHAELISLQEKGYKGVADVKSIKLECKHEFWVVLWNNIMGSISPTKKITSNSIGFYHFPYEFYWLLDDPKDWRNQTIKKYLDLGFDIKSDGIIILPK